MSRGHQRNLLEEEKLTGLQHAVPIYTDIGLSTTKGNPFIEAIGDAILDSPNFTEQLAKSLPIAPPNGHHVHRNPVLMGIDLYALYVVQYPTHMLARFNDRLLEILATGYLQRNPIEPRNASKTIYHLTTTSPEVLRNQLDKAPKINPPSILLLGASGMGKTFAALTALKRLPQLYIHESYCGKPFSQVQVVWLYVQCPSTGTLRALLLNILLEIDLVLGTQHHSRWMHSRESVDVLMIGVCVIMYVNGLGCLVLDELQHLKTRGYKDTETMLNFFVSIMNFLSVPIVSIGTYSAIHALTGVLRDSRRLSASGTLDFRRYEWAASSTRLIQDYYFSFLPGVGEHPLNDADHQRLYDIYQGFHFLLPNLVHRCSVEAATRGLSHVTPEVLDYYRAEELKPILPALDAVRSGDPNRIALWDDLFPQDAIQSLFDWQKRRHGEGEKPATSTNVSMPPVQDLDGPYHAEFAHLDFSPAEIAHACAESKRIFKGKDTYNSLRENDLVATDIAHGLFGQYPSRT